VIRTCVALTIIAATATLSATRAATAPAQRGAIARSPAATDVSALDLIELEIGYTTLLSVYYKPVAPKTLVDGARTGLTAYLVTRGIDTTLPYAPAHIGRGAGGDFVTKLVLDATLRHPKRVTARGLVQAAVAGEAAAVRDPYTLLFRPREYRAFDAYLGNDAFGGIGAMLAIDSSGVVRVESTFADGPAQRAGVRAGDAIVAIDGHSVSGRDAASVGRALRGKIGSTVRVSLVRDGRPLGAPIAIERAKIAPPVVTASTVEPGVGYVRLATFGDDAAAQVRSAIDRLQGDDTKALVLDLRGNGGGYGDEARKVASLFVSGSIFSTRDRTEATRVERASGAVAFAGAMAVLVDGDTASASEIVAGALQDDGRATIVGTKTFGKGVVQSIFPLPDGAALKVTTARYFTPKGRAIDRTGLEPDVVVAARANAVRGDPATDAQLARALDVVRNGL